MRSLTASVRELPEYLCAPCGNCKGQVRDLQEGEVSAIGPDSLQQLQGPDARSAVVLQVVGQSRILYGGLVELMVNAMVDAKTNFINWEWQETLIWSERRADERRPICFSGIQGVVWACRIRPELFPAS
jgi:hypothetical protein